jgi:hypothetical protein
MILGGSILLTGAAGFSAGVQLSLTDFPEKQPPATAQTLNLLHSDLGVPVLLIGIAAILLSTGIAFLRLHNLPSWFAWITIILGAIALTGFYLITIVAFIPWMIFISWITFRRSPLGQTEPSVNEQGDP